MMQARVMFISGGKYKSEGRDMSKSKCTQGKSGMRVWNSAE